MVKRLGFILLLMMLVSAANAQKILRNTSILNYQRGDRTWLHFGFTLGVNYMDYRVFMSGANAYRAETGKMDVGFLVGIISELRITDDLGFRFLPGLEFGTRRMIYTNVPEELDEYGEKDGKVAAYNESVYITLPFMLKYKAVRLNNFRPYLTAGTSLKYDFQKHDRLDLDKGVYFRTKPIDVFLEAGLGCDFYLPYFELGVELRFSLGLTNTLVREYDSKNPGYEGYTAALKKLQARMFTLCFNFE